MIWLGNIVRFVVVVLLQLLLINNLHFLGVVNPCIYILFLLALPAELPKWAQLLLGFATGLVVDIFCNSLGVHTFACTLICLIRPYLISRLVQEDERLVGDITMASLGWTVYLRYLLIMVLVHHSTVFILSAFTLHAFWLTLIQIVVSSALTVALLFGWELIKQR